MKRTTWTTLLLLAFAACGGGEPAPDADATDADAAGGAVEPLLTIDGFDGPEAVRYDPEQDVYFVSNFTGDAGERDGTGFISRVSAGDGTIETLRFAEGTSEAPLHSPRGMFITGDTLWAADLDGVHAFHRMTGESLGFTDLTAFEPGFLNDVAAGPDGTLYVTDTGRSAVYRVSGGGAEALADTALGGPNGITWDEGRSAFLLVPWEPEHPIHSWRPGSAPEPFGSATPGRLDGVELADGATFIASQTDSSIVRIADGRAVPVVRVGGRPADIGVDTRRGRVAVPYISLDRVDVWALPEAAEAEGEGGGSSAP